MVSHCSVVWILLLAHVHLQVARSVHVPALREVETAAATCPADEDLANARNQLMRDLVTSLDIPILYQCGNTTGWRRVAYLDMTDPSHSCPSGLAFKSISGLRLCGRADNNPGCWSTIYNISGIEYNNVCGRVRGYQYGGTSAFA